MISHLYAMALARKEVLISADEQAVGTFDKVVGTSTHLISFMSSYLTEFYLKPNFLRKKESNFVINLFDYCKGLQFNHHIFNLSVNQENQKYLIKVSNFIKKYFEMSDIIAIR